MEPKVSLLCSQEPTTGPYPELYASSPHLPKQFSKIHSNIILPSTPLSSEWSLTLRYSARHPVRATCSAHLNYLDFITPIIYVET
jgi:hypothetical protein